MGSASLSGELFGSKAGRGWVFCWLERKRERNLRAGGGEDGGDGDGGRKRGIKGEERVRGENPREGGREG